MTTEGKRHCRRDHVFHGSREGWGGRGGNRDVEGEDAALVIVRSASNCP